MSSGKNIQLIDLGAQRELIRGSLEKRIAAVLDHGQFIMGPEVVELEDKLSSYVGVRYCLTCANGTDALQLALMALGIGKGDIVFTTAFSFVSTAEVIPLVGAIPFFVDIDPDTYNICSNSLREAYNFVMKNKIGRPKAVISVDLFGLPAQYNQLESFCSENELYLIEDGAQSFGAAIDDRRCGSFGNVATTSFFPAKPLGCFGDGGAVFTDSTHIADLIKSIRVHGKGEHKYDNIRVGINSRLDTLQAAVLLEKLSLLDSERLAKQKVYQSYLERLDGSGYMLTRIPDNIHSAFALCTLVHESTPRTKIQSVLSQNGIPSAVYYPTPLNQSTAFANADGLSTPNCRYASSKVLSIPMHAYLSEEDIDSIVCALVLATE